MACVHARAEGYPAVSGTGLSPWTGYTAARRWLLPGVDAGGGSAV